MLTVPTRDTTRQLRNAWAVCLLLARQDLHDICTWTIRPEGVEAQLSAVYDDHEAHARIRDLTGCLDDGRFVNQRRGSCDGCSYTLLEAIGRIDGSAVRFWTHLYDQPRCGQEG